MSRGWSTLSKGAPALAIVLMLSGCATVWNMHGQHSQPPGAAAAEAPPPTPTVARLLGDGERYKSLTEEAQRRELTEVKERYRQRRSPDNLMRLALLMALSDTYRPDGAHVRTRLRDYVKQDNDRGGQWAPLASLLLHVLDERTRLLQETRTLRRKLDQHEADVRRLNDKLDQHKADEQRLSDKLNQLKAIEQKLNERSKREVIRIPP